MSLNLILSYESSALAAPQSFRDAMQAAANMLGALIQNNITVTIQVGYGDWDNGIDTGITTGAEGGDLAGINVSYSTLRAALATHETSTLDQTFVNSLPNTSTVNGVSSMYVPAAVAKALGLVAPNTTEIDGAVGMGTQIPTSLLVGVALHELGHALGREPGTSTFDLSRYTSPGVHLFSSSNTAPAAYFSIDGGYTKIADYGQTSDPSDFLNSGVQGPNDPFNEFYSWSTLQYLTTADIQEIDALGFNVTGVQRNIALSGTTANAVQGGAAIALLSTAPTITDSTSSTISSATIKIANGSGTAVVGDELYMAGAQSGTTDGGLVTIAWNDSTKVLTLTGSASVSTYQSMLSQITYKDNGTDVSTGSHPQHTVTWSVNDGTANITGTSQIAIERAPTVSVANVGLTSGYVSVAASSLFTASDPDADAIATYAFKNTGNGHFYLGGVAQQLNQEIDVSAAQLSQLVYNNALGTDIIQVRVSDGTLWSSWGSFTVTGPTVTVVQVDGSTTLSEVGTQYWVTGSNGAGHWLSNGLAGFVAGAYGAWTPFAAVQTATGFDVAWKDGSADLYSIWLTDANAAMVSSVSYVTGESYALQSYESTFGLDLNGDGHTGFTSHVAQTDGPTSLTQVADEFFLYNAGVGPSLKDSTGGVFTAGAYGAWTPIGAVQTASGYDVAWKDGSADLYSIWTTDFNGKMVSCVAFVTGESYALQSYESIFGQDLNGDGHIGFTTHVVQTDGPTSLTQVADEFLLYNAGAGPSLKDSAGGVFTSGAYGAWTPIGAVQTASGYDVAWKDGSADLYSIWTTDFNGKMVSCVAFVTGESYALQSYESIFGQDLNGDGHIGLAVAAGGVLEVPGAESGGVTFLASTGTLKLDAPQSFTGVIIGFTGNGTLAGSDQIDLPNLIYNGSIYGFSTYNSATGVLVASNGVVSDSLHFAGSYTLANFKFASDGHGGTLVYDPPAAEQAVPTHTLEGSAGSDTFVFPASFGNNTVVDFETTQAGGANHDVLQFSHTDLATAAEVLAAATQSGTDTVIAHGGDSATLHGIDHTTLQQTDFHIV